MFIDSHCHLDFPIFEPELEKILTQANDVGVTDFLVPATTYQSWKRIHRLSLTYPSIKTAYGIHPYFLSEQLLSHVDSLEEFASSNSAVAIGEIGLDYWPGQVDATIQIQFLHKQLEIAQNLGLPVVLHARKSYDELFSIVKKYQLPGGVVHAFTGSLVQAKRFIDLGFVLGVGGTITYPRANKTRLLFSELANSDYILETDSPDMPLYGHQGQINTPASVAKVAETLAELRAQSLENIAYNNRKNVLNVFSKWTIEDKKLAN